MEKGATKRKKEDDDTRKAAQRVVRAVLVCREFSLPEVIPLHIVYDGTKLKIRHRISCTMSVNLVLRFTYTNVPQREMNAC
jgi:hypothetical protein